MQDDRIQTPKQERPPVGPVEEAMQTTHLKQGSWAELSPDQFAKMLVRLVEAGSAAFQRSLSYRRTWSKSLDALRPQVTTSLKEAEDTYNECSNELWRQAWTTKLISLCAKACMKRHAGIGAAQSRLRKLLFCMFEMVNRLFEELGSKAFHVLTALGSQGETERISETKLRDVPIDTIRLAVQKACTKLAQQPGWSAIDNKFAFDPVEYMAKSAPVFVFRVVTTEQG